MPCGRPVLLRELGRTGSGFDLWLGHKRQLARTNLADKRRCLDLLGRLIAASEQGGAEILLLPACTFVYDRGDRTELERYFDLCRPTPWVVSGALGVDGPDAAQVTETTVILNNGEPIEQFPSGRAAIVQMGRVKTYSACSSSIGGIRGGKVFSSEAFPAIPESPILALDSGHHQYGGRYLLTLKSVSRYLGERCKVPNLVALAYWKYRDGQTNSPWLVAKDWEYTVEQKRVPSVVGGEGEEDLVSMIRV